MISALRGRCPGPLDERGRASQYTSRPRTPGSYIRSGADIPISRSARASVTRTAAARCNRAALSAGLRGVDDAVVVVVAMPGGRDLLRIERQPVWLEVARNAAHHLGQIEQQLRQRRLVAPSSERSGLSSGDAFELRLAEDTGAPCVRHLHVEHGVLVALLDREVEVEIDGGTGTRG